MPRTKKQTAETTETKTRKPKNGRRRRKARKGGALSLDHSSVVNVIDAAARVAFCELIDAMIGDLKLLRASLRGRK